jgi:hypothetical protein
MKKGLDGLTDDESIFLRDDAMTRLGVGKNMVRSIRHWCLAAEVIEEYRVESKSRLFSLRPSELGQRLLADDGWDPYLEDPATLWLLHWKIATNLRRATTWFWAFSHIFEPEFTKEGLLSSLQQWVATAGWTRVAGSSLKRDIDCFLRTYVPSRHSQGMVIEDTLDCPLIELNLIRDAGDKQTFQFNRGTQRYLPSGIVYYATLEFWQRSAPLTETMSLHDLAYAHGSPGRVFRIDEDSLAARYEQIESWTNRRVTYRETAGLKQLYRRRPVPAMDLLEQSYAQSAALAGGSALVR